VLAAYRSELSRWRFLPPLSWSDAVREPHCDQADPRSAGGGRRLLPGWPADPGSCRRRRV